MELVVDVRETALLAELGRQLPLMKQLTPITSISVRSQSLDVGDVLILHLAAQPPPEVELLVERKTLADLAASLRDGRYHEQRARLKASGARRTMYVIEAQPAALCMGIEEGKMPDVNGMGAARIQGCVSSMLLSQSQLAVTRSVEETAGLLLRLAVQLNRRNGEEDQTTTYDGYSRAACLASAVRSRKRDNVDPRQCYMQQLCQVPGVSHGIAKALAERFGSLRGIMRTLENLPDDRARAAELSRVPKVGPKLSARLCRYLLHEEEDRASS